MTNNYILATENDYNNPMVLCFSSAEDRAEYLKENYFMYSVNTKFYFYDDLVTFFESAYYDNQVTLLQSKYRLQPDDDSYIIFQEEVKAVVEEAEFDASVYRIDSMFR